MQNNTSELENENLISTDQIQNIYLKLSINEDVSFDIKDETSLVQKCIDECFDNKFKQISTKQLQENDELLNSSFVSLLKYCITKNFKKCSVIFIVYCDYFDLEYNKTFLSFHGKLQGLIKHACKCLIGSQCYKKYEQKNKGNSEIIIQSLFDLYQK